MTIELYWLTLTVLLTSILWIPYILNRFYEKGVITVLTSSAPDLTPKAAWAQRIMRAHVNAIENLIIFAPLVLTVYITGTTTELTATATMVYFYSRLVHVVVFAIGLPLFRTLAFLVGFGCQLTLALHLLQLI